MSILRSRRSLVVGVVLALAVAGAAFAYWTAGGSGTGAAATGTVNNIDVKQTTVVNAMYPGLAAQTLSGNFDNGNPGPVYVGKVVASIASVTTVPLGGACDSSDYTLGSPSMTVNAEVPAGTAKGAWTGATIAFNNKPGVNQDACKNATVNLAYTITP